MKDLISVIIPVYNVEKYLKKCLDSVINQTYKNLEIILVDDGSSDKSGLICDEYAKLDKRIKVLHKKNGGLSSARNTGLDIAKGKYISFIDSDDFVSIYMYEIMYKEIIKNNRDIVIARHIYFKNKEPIFKDNRNIYSISYYNNKDAICELLKLDNRLIEDYAWCKLYKKSLFKTIRFPINRVYEDIGTTYKLLDKSKKIVKLNCYLYAYYNNKYSITNINNIKSINDRIYLIDERYNYLIKKYKDLKEFIILNRYILLLDILIRSTYSINKKDFYNLNIYNILKNNKNIILKYNLPKKYYIEIKLLFLNKNLFRILNIIYNKLNKIMLIFKERNI